MRADRLSQRIGESRVFQRSTAAALFDLGPRHLGIAQMRLNRGRNGNRKSLGPLPFEMSFLTQGKTCRAGVLSESDQLQSPWLPCGRSLIVMAVEIVVKTARARSSPRARSKPAGRALSYQSLSGEA